MHFVLLAVLAGAGILLIRFALANTIAVVNKDASNRFVEATDKAISVAGRTIFTLLGLGLLAIVIYVAMH